MTDSNKPRYRFYRVHKFVSFELSELERLIARADFRKYSEVENVKQRLIALENMMSGHASYEDNAIHDLLRKKGSTVHEAIEEEHQHHHEQYNQFKNQLDAILAINSAEAQEQLWHEFYLNYRLFVSENLKHLHLEETVLMQELQRLCTDEELQSIQFATYSRMTPEHMAQMMAVVEPHINPNDKLFFLNEMKMAEPEKFRLSGLEATAELA